MTDIIAELRSLATVEKATLAHLPRAKLLELIVAFDAMREKRDEAEANMAARFEQIDRLVSERNAMQDRAVAAERNFAEAVELLNLFLDACDMMSDGPDESDEAMAKSKILEGLNRSRAIAKGPDHD